MIPKFPEFKKIEISDREEVTKYISQHPSPYSDFDFTSMWSWNTDQKFKISSLKDNLVVHFSAYVSGDPFFSFIGMNDVNETMDQVLTYAESMGMSPIARLVPEEIAMKLEESQFSIEEDRDNFDYVYSIKDLNELKGSSFADMRNQLNKTKKKHNSVKLSFLELQNDDHATQIKSLFNEWTESKKYALKLEKERLAIERLIALANSGTVTFMTLGVFDEERLIAFAINEVLWGGYAISHFVKANISYAGIYAFVMHAMVKALQSQDCHYLNYEQDLGIENLRYAKMCFRPVKFLKKYQVKVK